MDNLNISDALYQQLCGIWFVFAEINGEVLYSPIPAGLNPMTDKFDLHEILDEVVSKEAA